MWFFNAEGDKYRNKSMKDYITVSVVIDMVCGNTKNRPFWRRWKQTGEIGNAQQVNYLLGIVYLIISDKSIVLFAGRENM